MATIVTINSTDQMEPTTRQNINNNFAALNSQIIGGGVAMENPVSGTANGSNTVFNFTHLPLFVIFGNQIYVNGDGYTVNGAGPYVVTLSTAPWTTPHSFYWSILS